MKLPVRAYAHISHVFSPPPSPSLPFSSGVLKSTSHEWDTDINNPVCGSNPVRKWRETALRHKGNCHVTFYIFQSWQEHLTSVTVLEPVCGGKSYRGQRRMSKFFKVIPRVCASCTPKYHFCFVGGAQCLWVLCNHVVHVMMHECFDSETLDHAYNICFYTFRLRFSSLNMDFTFGKRKKNPSFPDLSHSCVPSVKAFVPTLPEQ